MIIKAELSHLSQILALNSKIIEYMQSLGYSHWSERYPTEAIYRLDISRGSQYVYLEDATVVGIVSFDTNHHESFDSIGWNTKNKTSFYVHRLAVDPNYQGKGIAKELMIYSEDRARDRHIDSIRLGAFKGYEKVVRFYKNLGYEVKGEILFDVSDIPFYGMEKALGVY